jgi:beta-lactamase class A
MKRRIFGSMALSTLASACFRDVSNEGPTKYPSAGQLQLAQIEVKTGGRLGVYALDTATGASLEQRANERFAMCSTFKWVLAAAVLEKVDRRELQATEELSYGPADLLEWAPVTREHVERGRLAIGFLAQAAVTMSDNTAANLLLQRIGGPEAVTAFMRDTGDGVTRLDRYEPSLNENSPGDPRDTTTPRAMAETMQVLLTTERLSLTSRQHLVDWLAGSPTGHKRLRAGLPQGWSVGDKTGTGNRGAAGDVAIAWPPGGGGPIVVACYTSDGPVPADKLDAAHAEVGQLVAHALG